MRVDIKIPPAGFCFVHMRCPAHRIIIMPVFFVCWTPVTQSHAHTHTHRHSRAALTSGQFSILVCSVCSCRFSRNLFRFFVVVVGSGGIASTEHTNTRAFQVRVGGDQPGWVQPDQPDHPIAHRRPSLVHK